MQAINVITYCTQNYYETSLNLIKTLNVFRKDINFYLYQVNFYHNPKIENVNVITLTEEKIGDISFNGDLNDVSNKNTYRAIFLKSRVMLHSLKYLKLNEVIYLDSDLLPNTDIQVLIDYLPKVKNYPLIQLGLEDYLIVGNRGNPFLENGGFDETRILEYPIMKKMGIPISQRTRYSNASIELYNKNCLAFIEEYEEICKSTFDLSLEEIKNDYAFADETVINLLLWKYQYKERLPFFQININDMDEIKECFYSNYPTEKRKTAFTRIPSVADKRTKIFFHGVKNAMSKSASQFIQDFYCKNIDFKIDVDVSKNRVNIFCDKAISVFVEVFDSSYSYECDLVFDNNLLFISPAKPLASFTNINVKISYLGKVLKHYVV